MAEPSVQSGCQEERL